MDPGEILPFQRPVVIGIGRHDGEDDALVLAAFQQVRRVEHRIAVVDAVAAEQVERRFDIARRFAELAGMGGAFQAMPAGQPVGFPEFLRRVAGFHVVHADADGFVARVPDDGLDHLMAEFGRGFPVDGRDQPADNAEIRLRVPQSGDHAVDRRFVADVADGPVVGRVPEHLAIADAAVGRVLLGVVDRIAEVVGVRSDWQTSFSVPSTRSKFSPRAYSASGVSCGGRAIPLRSASLNKVSSGTAPVK